MTNDLDVKTAGWFKTRHIAPQTWAIDDGGQDIVYLLYGQARCLLIDTGWGAGDLPALVASLCSLPLSVANTHSHPDHTFGNYQFDRVYIHRVDAPYVSQVPSLEARQRLVKGLPLPLPQSFCFDSWAASVPEIVPVEEGFVFDLGKRALEVISIPGHSPGSICLLDRKTRSLFSGDSIHSGTVWLHLKHSLPLRQFRANLEHVRSFGIEFDHVLPAHIPDLDDLPLPKCTLDDLIAGIERILDGQIVGYAEHTFAGDGLRCDFDRCSIIYNPERL
ncbi:MAG: MBL fold metallo-hydrolase [Anaerolineae bacterium]|nr:MBL fold metallo-hydrolase [Anaerolineae bacterium]